MIIHVAAAQINTFYICTISIGICPQTIKTIGGPRLSNLSLLQIIHLPPEKADKRINVAMGQKEENKREQTEKKKEKC